MLCAAATLLVGALGAPSAAAAGDAAMLRVAHLSPDTPAVDVALTPVPADGAPLTDPGPDVATGLGYGDVSPFAEVRPGSYAVSLRRAGAGQDTVPVLTTRVDVPAGAGTTVAIGGLFADLALQPVTDDLGAPPPGSARVRVLSAASGNSVDVGLDGGPTLAASLPFGGAASPVVVPAGPARLLVDGAPGDTAVLPLSWAPGSINTVLVLDGPDGGRTVRVVLDAAGPAVVPTGSVEAGGGAPRLPGALPWAIGAVAVLAAVSRQGRVLGIVATAVLAAAPGGVAPGTAVPAPALPEVVLAAGHRLPAAAPVRLQVPTAGVDTALAGTGLDTAGTLVPPADGTLAGWYREGPAPGDAGPAVLTGHVDGAAGPAVFFRLRQVAVGDPVLVGRADGSIVRFTVTRVARYPKGAFPTAEVYGPTADAQLRLITCGGAFDRTARSYLDNVVVYATVT